MPAATCVALLLATLLLVTPGHVFSSGGALAVLGAALLAAGWSNGLRGSVLVLVAALPAVATVAASNRLLAERWPDNPDGADTLVTGAVCEFPRAQPGSWRFVLTADAQSRARGSPSRVLVSWYEGSSRPASPPEPGERWQLSLRLRPPRGLSNPGTFDYERWLFAQHIGATGWVRDSSANGRLPGDASACPPAGWRAATARRIRAVLDGREAAPYVLGLAIGAYQELPEAEWDKLRRTGTIHLISISGFHIALLAGPAALLGLALARVLLAAGLRCRPRVIGAWTAVAAACAYGAFAGFSVPTARSVVAVAVVAALVTLRRAVTGPELLASVVLGVLMIEPLAPLVPGFWLSFAGVMVLAAAALGVTRHRTLPGALRALFTTQLAMTAGLAPLLVLFFGQLPVSGAFANLVAVPAFSLILLPLTLLATVAAWLAPSAGEVLLGLAADGFDAWRAFLGWCASLPAGVWYLPEPPRGALWLAGAGVMAVLWPRPLPGRWLSLGMFTGLLAAGAPPVPAGAFRVTALDVGQGLSVLVQTSGHALLYDAGPAFRDSDAGERVVVPVLQALGVRRLDVLLISHADADHRGGGASVLGRYPGAGVIGPLPGPTGAAACEAGRGWQWDGVRFDMLHPVAGEGHDEDNAASCVLLVSGPGGRLLLPGDIEEPVERALVSRAALRPVDLVVAPHHGSRTSSSAPFVAVTAPRYVIVSSGYRNRWRFPAGEVVSRWRESGACVVNTAETGALQFEAGRAKGLRLLRAERIAAPGLWLVRPSATAPCG